MRVDVSYGRGNLSVDLPENLDVTLIRKPDMPILADPRGAVEAVRVELIARRIGRRL